MTSIVQLAKIDNDKGAKATPIKSFAHEGMLPTDPRYRASLQNAEEMNTILNWSLCAKLDPTEVGIWCRAHAKTGILSWVRTYNSNGNPINDNRLIPLLLAISESSDAFNVAERDLIASWLRNLIQNEDAFFQDRLRVWPSIHKGNWNTWRLALRAIASRLLDDPELTHQTRGFLAEHIKNNLLPPHDWTPTPRCPSLSSL